MTDPNEATKSRARKAKALRKRTKDSALLARFPIAHSKEKPAKKARPKA
jgi:hypothetical protein